MNVVTVRQAIADQLDAALSIRVYPRMPDSPQLPAVVIYPGEPFLTPDDRTMKRSTFRLDWRIVVITPTSAGDDQSQQMIDQHLGTNTPATSIWDAIRDDITFGGVVAGSFLDDVADYGPTTIGTGDTQEQQWQATFNLQTWIKETET